MMVLLIADHRPVASSLCWGHKLYKVLLITYGQMKIISHFDF